MAIETSSFEQIAFPVTGLVVFLLVVRALYYHSKVLAISKHRCAYVNFVNTARQNPSEFEPYGEIAERQTEIVKLFEEAGQSPHHLAVVQQMGYGIVGTGSTNAWINLHDHSHETVSANLQNFHRTKGFFRARRNETLSPAFWIETLINWPATLLGRIGLDPEGSIASIVKLLALVAEIVGVVHFFVSQIQ